MKGIAEKKKLKGTARSAKESDQLEIGKKFFKLGKQAAQIEEGAKTNKQDADMNVMQKFLLSNATNQLKDLLAEIDRKQKTLEMQIQMSMQGMPPMGMPPQGMPPEAMGMPPQGMPPEAMGMPPQGMPPEAMGMPPQGMPPEAMGMSPEAMGMPPQGGGFPDVPAGPM